MFTLEQILQKEQYLEDLDLKKSAYTQRVKATNRFILEIADELDHPLHKWKVSMIMHAIKSWINDGERSKTVTNKVIDEVKSRILHILAQEGNVLTPAEGSTLKTRLNKLKKQRCLSGANPIVKKAMMIKWTEADELATHMLTELHNTEHKQRLADARHLALVFTAASAARVKDIIHLRVKDATRFQIQGVRGLSFPLRYSKSNRNGSRKIEINVLEDRQNPALCPVRAFDALIQRHRLLPHLSLLQRVDTDGIWENENPLSLDLEETAFTTASIVKGWNQTATNHNMHRIAGKLGAHSFRNTRINMVMTLTESEETVRDTAGWTTLDMLPVYSRNQLLNPKNPAYKYAQMSAQQATKLNMHLY